MRTRRRLARAPSMPGFSQKGDSCGAASLVTALFLWDLERPSTGNTAVVHACDLDSREMVLGGKRLDTFYSAWVVLSDAAGNKGTPFAVKP